MDVAVDRSYNLTATPDTRLLLHKQDKKSKKFKELKNMNESLLKENLAKERELRLLNKDMHQYEQKVLDLRKEISSTKCSSTCAKRDAEVSAKICCSERVESGSGAGETKFSVMLKDEANKWQEKVRAMETKLKSADNNVYALRKVNVALSEELHALRRVCAALDEQCRASTLRAQFKDEIIKEMRRQLKQAKAKLQDSAASGNSGNITDIKTTNVSCQALASSTPVRSVRSARSDPDLSIIERDPSVQNTSADSVENLERMLYRDCCLTPSSMLSCARQARMLSATTGSQNFVPTVGLALSNTTNGSHSPERTRHTRNPIRACDCPNITDRRSLVERLLSYTAPADTATKDDQKLSESSSSKSPEQPQERKTSKKSSFAGFFKKNKSTKTSESSDNQDAPDRESKKAKHKNDRKNKSSKNSDADVSGKQTKNSKKKSSDSDDSGKDGKTSKKKSFFKSKKKSSELEESAKRNSKAASTSREDFGQCTCGSKSTEHLSTKDSRHSNTFWSSKKQHPDHEEGKDKSSKQSLAQEKRNSKDSESLHDSSSSSKKEKKSIWKRKKKEKDKKSTSKGSSDSSSDLGESGPVDAATGTEVLSPVDVGASTCTWNSIDSLLCGKILPISSCPNSPCGSPRPDPLCRSYPCSPRENASCFPAAKPCLAKSLTPCTSKPCPRLPKGPCGTKSLIPTPCPHKISCAPNPCSAKTVLKPCTRSPSPCGSPRPCGSKISGLTPCPDTSSLCASKPCPAKSQLKPGTRPRSSSPCGSVSPCSSKPCPINSLLKPCSRSQNSSPCRSPSPCGSKLSSEIPCPGSSSPCAPKPCPAKTILKPCARSISPPCGLSGFKISSLLPCPFNISSPCNPKPPCDTKSPCFTKAPCDTKPCVPKSPCDTKPPCPAKSRPCTPPLNPCESPQNSDESLLDSTLSKLSNFLTGPCKTSTPCAPKPCPGKKPCSHSQNSSPCRSPTLSEDSCLNKTYPFTPKPCPATSAPCTRKPCPSGLNPCIAKPCPSKPPCIRKTPCAPKPCHEISPCDSPINSPDSSCIDICSPNEDPCEQETAPCESTFNPFDFLKRCVQFLPSNENLKPLCPQEVCPRGEAVCPAIREEIDASTDCNPGTDKCVLTQEESCDMAGMCEAARAQYYRNKLISTQQILENKEETIRIQGESLAVAESQLTTLTIRAGQLRQELECKSKELRMLRREMSGCCCQQRERKDACAEVGVSSCADLHKHKNVVKTLQTNLSIIEELYSECFFETAKQEALIEKLRQSYLDVRLSDKGRSDEIGRLQNVVNTQKSSLDQCQDIATEVEGLKIEISNFLNSSNNDSGMWERSEDSGSTDVGEDLQQIMDQLLQLKGLLHQEDPLITELSNDNCRLKCDNDELTSQNCRLKCENEEMTDENCRLKCENDELTDENCRLKCDNNELEAQIGDYRQRVCGLECTIRNNEEVIENLGREKECIENQLRCAQNQAEALTQRVSELECANRCAQEKISELQCLLNATKQKLKEALEQICHHECTEAQLREQLEEAKQLAEENERICSELCALQQSVRTWSAQLQESQARVCALHAELQRARARADTADLNYRQQAEMTTMLQQQLEEAHARGEFLCEESRRIVCAVRQWVRDNCAKFREQEKKIKRQQTLIWTLNKELEEKQCCCAPPPAPPPPCGLCRTVGCTKCGRARERERERERERCGLATCPALHVQSETGVCEVASCSSGPVPPRRISKKKSKACNERCVSRCRSASAQQPEGTRDAATCAAPAPAARCCTTHNVRHLRLAGTIGPSVSPPLPRGQSPSQELLQRVENLHDALVTGQRRWGRARAPAPAPADRRS